MQGIRDNWAPRLEKKCARLAARGEKPAIVLDADDTTLWTYDMEDAAMHFNFDPALQDEWVQDKRFKPVPGMRQVVRSAAKAGCRIVGLTGRSYDQRRATIQNLNKYYVGPVQAEVLLHQVEGREAAVLHHLCGGGRVHARGVQVADEGARGEEVRPPHHRQLR